MTNQKQPPTPHLPKLRYTDETGHEKFCTKCREWWPADLEFFFADPTGGAGLFYACKACYREMDRRPGRRPSKPAEGIDWSIAPLINDALFGQRSQGFFTRYLPSTSITTTHAQR